MNIILKTLSGGDSTYPHIHVLKAGPSLIGSAENCSVKLSSTGVSKWHCILDVSPNAVYVTDLHSLNGTYVNERQIIRQALKDGDRLRIGQLQLLVDIARPEQGRALVGGLAGQAPRRRSRSSIAALPLLKDCADRPSRSSGRRPAGGSAGISGSELSRQLARYEKALNNCSTQLRVLTEKVDALQSKLNGITKPSAQKYSSGGAFERHDAMMYIARAAISDRVRQKSLPSPTGN